MENLIQQSNEILAQGGITGWLAVAVIATAITLLLKLTLRLITSRLRYLTAKTSSIWDDVGLDIIDGLKSFVIFIWTLYLLSHPLLKDAEPNRFFKFIVVAVTSYQVALWGIYLLKCWRTNIIDVRIKSDPSSSAALGLLYTALQVLFLVIVVLLGLSNLGVDITALIAGLGVGGIAVALAAQNVLGDLLASLSIVLDKPFAVGDFIVTGTDKGTVEQIGIKTTRLRSLSGEQLVLSNKDVLESRIQNFKRMWTRRVVHKIGVVYSTPAEKLEQIPVWIQDIIVSNEKLTFDRCHFMSYGASSLDFEFVFFVQDSDYNVFMNIQQKVLLDIFKKFNQEKVEFAFPTQTLHVASLPENQRPQA